MVSKLFEIKTQTGFEDGIIHTGSCGSCVEVFECAVKMVQLQEFN